MSGFWEALSDFNENIRNIKNIEKRARENDEKARIEREKIEKEYFEKNGRKMPRWEYNLKIFN